ncbi:hypothetical protein AOC36_07035 [Erysipelothrix larvae]|uniref:Outer surface protein n=1 Tax=Erysipelothrix larvae TaxID=1514105 RepID=A0A0X8H0D6_9FIRM|nr:MupG family TIM beta-alpha barrel fold protein [Erysipelothrix larvae]AMC93746.1 hypothetical protein AOC36_07035 [Erysipelothrix larvae]
MGKKGISIYPDVSDYETTKAYIEKAAHYGFTRVFTNLLETTATKEELMEKYGRLNRLAASLGMDVYLDVTPGVMKQYGKSYTDLSFFKELGAAGIRLDESGSAHEDALLTNNPDGIKIEFNASTNNRHMENVLSFGANVSNMVTCHNFYPQKYTGLGFDLFVKTSQQMKDMGLNVAAFVSSQVPNSFGPWPVNEGLCTLEDHRFLPLDLQARHLYATGLVDDVIIANCYPSDEELQGLGTLQEGVLTMRVDFEDDVLDIEREIACEFNHFVRGDMSDYMARSTMSRIVYKDAQIPAHNTRDLKRGDVIIVNEEYGRYKGEIHIVLKDMENDGRKNVIGRLNDDEQVLLQYLTSWKPFKLI